MASAASITALNADNTNKETENPKMEDIKVGEGSGDAQQTPDTKKKRRRRRRGKGNKNQPTEDESADGITSSPGTSPRDDGVLKECASGAEIKSEKTPTKSQDTAEKQILADAQEVEDLDDAGGEWEVVQESPTESGKKKRQRRRKRNKSAPTNEDATADNQENVDMREKTPTKSQDTAEIQILADSQEMEDLGVAVGGMDVVQESPTESGKKKRNRRRNRNKSAPTDKDGVADNQENVDMSTPQAQSSQQNPSGKPQSTKSSSAKDSRNKKDTAKNAPPSVKGQDHQDNIDKSTSQTLQQKTSQRTQSPSLSSSTKDSQNKKETAKNTPPSVRRKDQHEKTPRKPKNRDHRDSGPHTPKNQDRRGGGPQTPKNQDQRGSGPNTPQQGSNRSHRNRANARTPRTPQSGRNYGGTPGKQKFKPFEDYLSLEEASDGLKREQLYKGTVRINPRNFEESYVDNPTFGEADFLIQGITARNRALPGDVVAVQVLPKSEWKVLLTDYKVHLANQKTTTKSSKKDKTRTTTSDVTNDLQKLTINNSATTSDGKAVESLNQSKPSTDNVKQDLKQTHEEELQDMEKVVKKLFADDILEGAASGAKGGTTNDVKDGVARKDEDEGVIPDKCYQRTAKVVYIIEKKHSRACTGYLKKQSSQNATDALFSPVDSRLPRIYIPLTECPDGFQERPQDSQNTLFIARIDNWPQDSVFAKGHLHRSLGEAGEIEPETEGIIVEHDIDSSEFDEKVLDCLPKDLPWKIPAEELAKRRDLRKECIFTIDPATARDLDDALHCKSLGKGVYELGVHIADVSFFVKEDTALDKKAGERATSVYLVQRVIPMLPRLLCEKLCSLNPDEDRLTFSVIWKMTEDGKILDEWCGRSVIRSCVKMAYDHAQDIIENPNKAFSTEELPPITNGFKIPKIMESVINLNKIAVNLRKKRFDSGALRLDQVKLQFALNHETGMPSGYFVYQQRDSNKLVEEFMLLANMAVAHRIHDAYKETALLRRHPPPKSKMMDDLIDQCHEMGIDINGETSGELQDSLSKYMGEDQVSKGMQLILTSMYSKPMQRALYFCTGSIGDEEAYRHYALNVPFYTHFTSPIRRYADVIVHRLLAASLGCGPEPTRDAESTQGQASHCNKKKDKAKEAGDRSSELFFASFIKECGPIEEDAMVMQVLDHSFDVLIFKLGVTQRVYCNKLPLKRFDHQSVRRQTTLTLVWEADNDHPESTQEIKMFTVVRCILESGDNPRKWGAIIKRPEESDLEPTQ